jgi:hypothetical protein
MASERDQAISSVSAETVQSNESEKLEVALSQGEGIQRLAMAQSHEMNMRRAELGWFGKVFGGEAHASIVVAFVVIILGFTGAIGLWVVAYYSGKPEFWSSEAHISLAAATSALGFVFGRGSKDNSK